MKEIKKHFHMRGIWLFLLMTILPFTLFGEQTKELAITSIGISQRETLGIFFEVNDNDKKVQLQEDKIVPSVKQEGKEVPLTYELHGSYNRGTAYTFLIDVSGSNYYLPKMVAAMKSKVESLEKNDQVCLITCGEKIDIIEGFTSDKEALKKRLDQLSYHEDETRLYTGLMDTMNYISSQAATLPEKKVIILFTDGINVDSEKEVQIKEIVDQVKTSNRVYPIYGVSFDFKDSEEMTEKMKELKEVVEASRGIMLPQTEGDLVKSYEKIFQVINELNYIELSFDAKPGKYQIILDYEEDGSKLTQAVEYDIYKALENKQLECGKQEEVTKSTEPVIESEMPASEETPILEETSISEETPAEVIETGSRLEQETKRNLIIFGAISMSVAIVILVIVFVCHGKRKASKKNENKKSKQAEVKTMLGLEITLSALVPGEFEPMTAHIEGQLVVGSSSNKADLIFDFGEAVLPSHFVLQREETKLFIFNVDDKNETYVNGYLLRSKRELRAGDIIAFGGIEAVIHF